MTDLGMVWYGLDTSGYYYLIEVTHHVERSSGSLIVGTHSRTIDGAIYSNRQLTSPSTPLTINADTDTQFDGEGDNGPTQLTTQSIEVRGAFPLTFDFAVATQYATFDGNITQGRSAVKVRQKQESTGTDLIVLLNLEITISTINNIDINYSAITDGTEADPTKLVEDGNTYRYADSFLLP